MWDKIPGFGIATGLSLVLAIVVYLVSDKFGYGYSIDKYTFCGIWFVGAAVVWLIGLRFGWWGNGKEKS